MPGIVYLYTIKKNDSITSNYEKDYLYARCFLYSLLQQL